MSGTQRSLKTVIFMGSAKNVIPPWGGDSRLGDRVLKWVASTLKNRRGQLGGQNKAGEEVPAVVVTHEYSVVDPLDVFKQDGGALAAISSSGELNAPTFFLKELPPATQALKDLIVAADCYIIVSPEYNHSVPPALASVMGHFGGSCYAAKPCGVVTYSSGPWGGMRGAMAICTMCHELGCLPVSKLCGIPTVADLLTVDGTPAAENQPDRMLKQLPDMLTQLEWMALAMKDQRDKYGVF